MAIGSESETGVLGPDPAGRLRGAARRLTGMSTGRWLLLGVVLAVLSLGLPWSHAYGSAGVRIPGWYVGGICTTNYADGTLDCPLGYVSPGLTVATSHQAAGLRSVARFYVAAAVVLALVGWRRRARGAVLLAILSLVLSVFVVSRSLTSGAATVLLAAACLGIVARRLRVPG